MSTYTLTRYPCARCGRKQPAERMVFSTFSRKRYCVDLDGCARRAERRQKQVAA